MILKYPQEKDKLSQLKAGDIVEFEGKKLTVIR